MHPNTYPQKIRTFHVYDYEIPLEDWSVQPRRDETTYAQMEYMSHSNRIYIYWKRTFANPINKIGPPIPSEFGGTYQPTHWGTTEIFHTTTFYVRDIPEKHLPPPYEKISVTLTYGQAGGPQMDDPLGEYPYYDVIKIHRTANQWDKDYCLCPKPISIPS